MNILVLNCGSSSIKYQLFEMPGDRVLARGRVQRIGERSGEAWQQADAQEISRSVAIRDHGEGLRLMRELLTLPGQGPLHDFGEIQACGHRVVHGGEAFTGSVKVTKEVQAAIAECVTLAPLHNPANLAGIRELQKLLPAVPQVACFDTAFHQTLPPVAYLYGLPYHMYEVYRVRRYGFHGISHRYVARRAAERMHRHKYAVNLITCHLGNGCSITAVREGRSVDTSMGLTPLPGLLMGTRPGDFDPAIVLYLLRQGHTAEQLDALFNKKSGLMGLSGVSNDLRDLEAKADAGHVRAQLALEIFAYRIKQYIGSYLAVLNGCDALVFTGGIGENAVRMRERILSSMDRLGIQLDLVANAATHSGLEAPIHHPSSSVHIYVIPTNEELAIARDTYALVTGTEP